VGNRVPASVAVIDDSRPIQESKTHDDCCGFWFATDLLIQRPTSPWIAHDVGALQSGFIALLFTKKPSKLALCCVPSYSKKNESVSLARKNSKRVTLPF